MILIGAAVFDSIESDEEEHQKEALQGELILIMIVMVLMVMMMVIVITDNNYDCDGDDIYIMMKCLFVCVSRKMITSFLESRVTTCNHL